MKNVHDALTALYRHAEKDMQPEELEGVAAVLTQEAGDAALNLSAIVGGLASLVGRDAQHKPGTGCFQDAKSVSPLLWGISQQFDHLAALIRVGDEARQEATSRRELAAEQAQPKEGRAES
ncbi:hypothetical protein [Zoogloea sp.]|uniref:hypothetical protein n=1 Tax=Zoogloea sp. TaxID=49181 RepID=UPI00261E4FF6|nr:hypothetical protein [uncultured Zoogloea sp.]